VISENTLNVLEYQEILKLVSSYAFSRPAREQILKEMPENDIEKVKYLLDLTADADKLLYEMAVNISLAFDDISESLELVHRGVTLNPDQLLKVARAIKVAKVAKKNILSAPDGEVQLLKELTNHIFVATDIDEKIDSCIVSETEVSSNASSKLYEVRQEIANTNRKIREKLQSYISSSQYASYLQDNIVTVRSGRYVIPVKTAYKGMVKGLIHDQSSTGSTTFIEPIAIVELNNELRSLEIEEQQEIEKILRMLSDTIDASYYEIVETYQTIIKLDIIFAKAQYSRVIKGIYPDLNTNGQIDIIEGRHPLIDKSRVVAVSISLGEKYNTLLISGPNTGGKTVSIKLVGILTLMAMSGIFVPARVGTKISIFEDILCDIGDQQSIENNLSTFSAHLMTIINIVNKANDKSLVLLDELGSGTDPVEGAALAIAVISYLKERHVKTIVTSHYKELKEFAYSSNDVTIAGMDFEPVTFKPTYRLIMGQTASSNALEIAKLLGLKEDIVNNAKSLISDEDNKFNNIIRGAEITRKEAEDLKQKALDELKEIDEKLEYYNKLIEIEEQKKAKLEEKLQKSAKEVLGDYLDEAEELVEELKEKVQQGDEQALFEARKLKKQLEKMQVQSKETMHYNKVSGEIQVGDDVFVKALNEIGKVLSIAQNKKEAQVKVGVLTMNVKLKELEKVKVNQPKEEKKKNVSVKFAGDYSFDISTELNLIGKNTDEALYELEYYLGKAKAKGYETVRIVHGKGEGILRKAVQEYLKKSKYVASYRLGGYGEGDVGVTIVTMKKWDIHILIKTINWIHFV